MVIEILIELTLTRGVDAEEIELDHATILSNSLSKGRTQKTKCSNKEEKQSWTQRELDGAIRKYKAARASTYHTLVDAVATGNRGAQQDAYRLFGRNAIARALGVKAAAMVSKSPAWQQIKNDLNLKPSGPSLKRIGYEIAVEKASSGNGDLVTQKVINDETVRLVEQQLPNDLIDPTLEKYCRGEMTDDQVRQMIAML